MSQVLPTTDVTGGDLPPAETMLRNAVTEALEQSRSAGVPISLTEGRYELPDGEIVDHDPWHGERTAPVGWYEKYNIAPANRPPINSFAFLNHARG